MSRIGVLSFSDGRERVHDTLKEHIQKCENALIAELEKMGVEVLRGDAIIHSNATARSVALSMASQLPDACILNVPVFAFPNFSVIAAHLLRCPVMATSPQNGSYPGLGGMLACVDSIRQTGMHCEKMWQNPDTEEARGKLKAFISAAHASAEMNGSVYGLIGGRSIGMSCGVVHPDRWMQLFGIDVEHIDESEILRLALECDPKEVAEGTAWIRANVARVAYDGGKLTPDSLENQVRAYLAVQHLIWKHGLSFLSAKCHYDMSEYHYALCLAAALCNDPYDWNGPKKPCVFACEADNDGALSMQLLHLLTGKPALFMDFRDYRQQDGLFAFCNCGSCATWYARRSDRASENLATVTLDPLIAKYNGTGCHVRYLAQSGELTFARFIKVMDAYRLQVFTGSFEQVPESYMNETCARWPHGFARVNADPYTLIERYESNHVHAVAGNCMDALKQFCRIKNIPMEVL